MPKLHPIPFAIAALGLSALLLDFRHYVEEDAPVEQRPEASVPALQPLSNVSKESEAGEKNLRDIFAAGKFVEAKSFIDGELRKKDLDVDYSAWLRKQLVIVKTALAWTAVQKRDCRSAQEELSGLDMSLAPPLAAKALGFCAMQEKDWVTAEQYLDFYTEKQGQDPEGFMLLSSVKEAQGSYDEAIDLNEKALTLDESSQRLAKKAQSLNAQQEESQTQTEISSGSIRIRFQAPMHFEIAQASLAIVNDTIQNLNMQLGLEYPQNTIEVIFHSVDHFERITHGPAWASALYDGEIRMPIEEGLTDVRKIAAVLRHEITHAVLDEQARKRPLPPWFQEGLAQIAECPNFCWSYTFDATTHPFLAVERLNQSFLDMPTREAHVAYKQSRYLMTTLYREKHMSGIKEILLQLPELPSLDSESLLQVVDWSFKGLHENASHNWKANRSL